METTSSFVGLTFQITSVRNLPSRSILLRRMSLEVRLWGPLRRDSSRFLRSLHSSGTSVTSFRPPHTLERVTWTVLRCWSPSPFVTSIQVFILQTCLNVTSVLGAQQTTNGPCHVRNFVPVLPNLREPYFQSISQLFVSKLPEFSKRFIGRIFI